MKILLCGGGTGGHITPILAIAHEIKRKEPDSEIIYIGEHGGRFAHLVKNVTSIDQYRTIRAGKFRRYHGESWLVRIFDFKTNLLNLRDAFFVVIGIFQSLRLISKEKPDVIFLKGGYVGLPLGLAAAIKKKPFITHDSDAISSLTNKIVGKWARYNATGMPPDNYSYSKDKVRFVGVPVAPQFESVSDKTKMNFRDEIGIPKRSNLLLVTGGSLGAVRLNKAFIAIVEQLFSEVSELHVVHQVGAGNTKDYKGYKNYNLRVEEFIPDLYKYSGAADVVLTRTGANTISELAVQGKAIVVIPNPDLTGGHQIKNGDELATHNAAIVVSEQELHDDPKKLLNTLKMVLNDKDQQMVLAANLSKQAIPDSAAAIAMLLLSVVK